MSEENQKPGAPYLAIKNWSKYQKLFRDKPAPYIFDFTDQDSDYDFSKLHMFVRGVYAGCRRLRGRFGHNLHNDPTWVARSLNTLPTERARIADALRTLIKRGLLIPTESKGDDHENVSTRQNGTKLNDDRTDRVPPSQASPVTHQETPNPAPVQVDPKSSWSPEVQRLAAHFTSKTEHELNDGEKGLLGQLLKKNAKHSNAEERVRTLIDFALDQSWFADKIRTFAFLYDHLDTIVPDYTAHLRGKKKGELLEGGKTKRGDDIASRKESEI